MLFKKLYALCVVVMFDIGAALVITYFYPFPFRPNILLFIFGAGIVLLPDSDLLVKKEKDSTHRQSLLHQPLFMFIIGFLISFIAILIAQLPFITAFYVPLLWFAHFAHDTVGCSGSLAWLAPFNQTNFWVTTEKVAGAFSRRIVLKKQASPNIPLDQWLKNYYHFTVEAAVSWLVFLIGTSLAVSTIL